MNSIENTEFLSIHACDWMNLEFIVVSIGSNMVLLQMIMMIKMIMMMVMMIMMMMIMMIMMMIIIIIIIIMKMMIIYDSSIAVRKQYVIAHSTVISTLSHIIIYTIAHNYK